MTFRSDIDEAQSSLDKATALNAKVEAERLNLIAALNKAVVVIGMLGLFGVAFVWSMSAADDAFKAQDLRNQEVTYHGKSHP